METKIASTYATLTLTSLEEHLYEIIGKKYYHMKTEFIRSRKRYLYNCFVFWKCPWGNINDLHDLLQNVRHKIKFTMEHNFK